MSFSLFILGIVIGGLATLTTLIFMIISFAGGKTQNALIWGAGFLVSISILILSIVNAVRRVTDKVKNGVEWAVEQSNGLTTDTDTTKYGGTEQVGERQTFLDTLKVYTNDSYEGKVPADYYANKPATKENDSSIIVPFLYPLSIRYNQNTYLGDIMNSANDSVYLNNVSQMAFDQNFVIARVDNTNDKKLLKEGHGEIEYVLFDMRTREYLTFVNMTQLLDKSNKIGYVGPTQLNYLSNDYNGWVESPGYD